MPAKYAKYTKNTFRKIKNFLRHSAFFVGNNLLFLGELK